MARCKDCIHEKVCLHKVNIQTDTYAYMGVKYDTEKCKHYTSADVVPKSEVEKWKEINEQLHKEMSERILEERKIERKLVAREIFEEIERYCEVALMNGHIETPILCIGHSTLAELKKKYTKEV